MNYMDSYERHEHTYRGVDMNWVKQRLAILEEKQYFKTQGFQRALAEHPEVRELHIDIGCGAGWLLVHTAPLFNRVIGIEPSVTATDYAKEYTKEFKNITYINQDMLVALQELAPNGPYFITTSAVFCHIQEYHVRRTLSFINNAPVGSTLCFNEPYGRNIRQPFWYLYGRQWWRDNLSNWDLEFLDITDHTGGKPKKYLDGIIGVCVGETGARKHPRVEKYTAAQRVRWVLSGYYYTTRYSLIRAVKMLFKVKDKYL